MFFLYNFSFSRLKPLLILTAILALPACSAGGAGDAGVDTTSQQSGAVGIEWSAPVEREDVSPMPLYEIANYRVYYGTEAGVYQNQLTVDGSMTSAAISGLSSGTYYVVVVTVDTDGRESAYSTELVVTV